MKPAADHAQSWPEAAHGSRADVEVTMPPAILGRVAQDGVHVYPVGIRRQHSARCLTVLPVHTGRAFGPGLFPIARPVQPTGLECGRLAPRGLTIGRRAVFPSRFRRLATNTLGVSSSLPAGGRNLSRRCALGRQTGPGLPQGIVLPAIVDARHSNSCCPLSRGSSAKPIQTDASACKPSAQSHSESLSCVRRLDDRDRDTKGFRDVGTAFQGGRNVFRG
jgi:hypothetical protein